MFNFMLTNQEAINGPELALTLGKIVYSTCLGYLKTCAVETSIHAGNSKIFREI